MKLGYSNTTLKLIAIVTMFLDHFAIVSSIDPALKFVMRFAGSISAPIVFFLLVEGYHHTSNVGKYTVRLLIFAMISYIPYIYFNTGMLPDMGNYLQLNVIFTLLLGLLALRINNEVHRKGIKIVLLCLIFVASTFCDWGYIAIVFILAFDYFYDNDSMKYFVFTILVLMVTMPYVELSIRMQHFSLDQMQILGMFCSLYILKVYNKKLGKGGAFAKWSFYIFYPAHLLLLGIMNQYVLIG